MVIHLGEARLDVLQGLYSSGCHVLHWPMAPGAIQSREARGPSVPPYPQCSFASNLPVIY